MMRRGARARSSRPRCSCRAGVRDERLGIRAREALADPVDDALDERRIRRLLDVRVGGVAGMVRTSLQPVHRVVERVHRVVTGRLVELDDRGKRRPVEGSTRPFPASRAPGRPARAPSPTGLLSRRRRRRRVVERLDTARDDRYAPSRNASRAVRPDDAPVRLEERRPSVRQHHAVLPQFVRADLALLDAPRRERVARGEVDARAELDEPVELEERAPRLALQVAPAGKRFLASCTQCGSG